MSSFINTLVKILIVLPTYLKEQWPISLVFIYRVLGWFIHCFSAQKPKNTAHVILDSQTKLISERDNKWDFSRWTSEWQGLVKALHSDTPGYSSVIHMSHLWPLSFSFRDSFVYWPIHSLPGGNRINIHEVRRTCAWDWGLLTGSFFSHCWVLSLILFPGAFSEPWMDQFACLPQSLHICLSSLFLCAAFSVKSCPIALCRIIETWS